MVSDAGGAPLSVDDRHPLGDGHGAGEIQARRALPQARPAGNAASAVVRSGDPIDNVQIADKHRIFFENEEDEKNDRRNIGQYFEDRFSSLTTSIGEKPKFVSNP